MISFQDTGVFFFTVSEASASNVMSTRAHGEEVFDANSTKEMIGLCDRDLRPRRIVRYPGFHDLVNYPGKGFPLTIARP